MFPFKAFEIRQVTRLDYEIFYAYSYVPFYGDEKEIGFTLLLLTSYGWHGFIRSYRK